MPMVTIAEASQRLGVSLHTLKRRLKRGELQGKQRPTPQGYVWTVAVSDDIPPASDDTPDGTPPALSNGTLAPTEDADTLREMVSLLQGQMTSLQEQLRVMNQALATRDNEVAELTTVIRQQQAMLPQPERRGWLRRLFGG